MKLLAATGNPHKLEEFRRILTPLGISVISPAEAGVRLDVEETGATFAENARLKAFALRDSTGFGVVADDSGLCIDALDGKPGVLSARYLGEDTPQEQKNQSILHEMRDVPDNERGARFICAICCALADGTLLECEGVCEGRIGKRACGAGGFGYDPIFYVNGCSFADLSPQQKDAVSHRGHALRQLVRQLRTYFKQKGDD